MCLSIIGGGTLAYFTDSTTAHNVIMTGNINIEIIEKFDSNAVAMPGTEVEKVVQVQNTGANDAWVRVAVDKKITLADGTEGNAGYLMTNYENGSTSSIYNSINWTLKDGYYYYKDILPVGKTTEPLFTDVLFDKKMGNEYQNCTAQVYVFAQATQVDNNGSTVLEAKGWPN